MFKCNEESFLFITDEDGKRYRIRFKLKELTCEFTPAYETVHEHPPSLRIASTPMETALTLRAEELDIQIIDPDIPNEDWEKMIMEGT